MLAALLKPLSCTLLLASALGCEAARGETARDHGAQRQPAAPLRPQPKASQPQPLASAAPAPASAPASAPAPAAAPDPAADRRARFPSEFLLTSMRGTSHAPYLEGNTRDALEAAAREGIRYVEVDFVLTRDDVLVTAHQAYVKGCGPLNTMLVNQVLGCKLPGGLRLAKLETLLKLPFKGLFLDLKDTRDPDPARARRAVERAASAVVQSQRTADVVLMLYDTPPDSVKPIHEHGLRAGIKGYPKSVEETARMVDRAAELGFEMVSVNTEHVTPELIATSTQKGVWQLPWSTDPADAEHWRALAAAGAGGLIALHFELAQKQVVPHWVDARTTSAH